MTPVPGSHLTPDDLDAWLAESNLMKRTFRQVALIAGLVERRSAGREKTGRQVALSTNLIYDVLRRHDPHHILLEAAWADAATGLLDIARLGDFLRRIDGRIRHQPLDRVSPLSVPILLEIGKEAVAGAFLGRDGWCRISETWPDPDLSEDELALELGARLTDYITALEPVRRAKSA